MTSGSLSFIGEFLLLSNSLTICDPLVNEITRDIFSISCSERTSLILRNFSGGWYQSAYELGKSGEASSALIYPITNDYSHINAALGSFIYVGTISCSVSNSLAAIESQLAHNAMYSLYDIEPEAFYEPYALRRHIDNSSFVDSTKCKIKEYLNECIINNDYAIGKHLCTLFEEPDVFWDGFRDSEIPSSHWGCDIKNRLETHPCCIIKGGIALTAFNPLCNVFVLRGEDGFVKAVRINAFRNT